MNALARGRAAGVAGTAALTLSQRAEMALTGRPASDLPASVAERALRTKFHGRTRDRVAVATHWVNNTQVGLSRAALDAFGVRGTAATAGTFAAYVGGSTLMFATLGLPQSPRRRALDLAHAAVYAVAASAVYERLD